MKRKEKKRSEEKESEEKEREEKRREKEKLGLTLYKTFWINIHTLYFHVVATSSRSDCNYDINQFIQVPNCVHVCTS